MKKNILFLAVIALLAVSCGNNKKTVETVKKQFPQLYYAGENVTTSDTAAIFKKKTVKWTVCGTDKKVKGTVYSPNGDTVFSHTVTAQGPAVPADSLAAWAGNTTVVTDCDDKYGGENTSGGTNSGSSGSGFWRFFLNWLLPILLAIIALILLIRGISWLINNWPVANNNSSSSKKQNDMKNPERIAALNAMISNLKGTNGDGKGSVKDNGPEGFKVVVGEKAKAKSDIYIVNTGNGNVYNYNGDGMAVIDSGNTIMPTPVRVIIATKKEPKKEEPAAPAN